MFGARKLCWIDSLLPLKFRTQSNWEHFDKESRDYLPSKSRKNQSKDDSESAHDGFGRFTDHQVHLSTSCQWLCLSCMTSQFVCFFLLLTEIISIAKLFIIVHSFVLKHGKQTLSYIHTKFEGNENNSVFFLQFIWWGHPLFCPNTEITWAWEVYAPVITWYE